MLSRRVEPPRRESRLAQLRVRRSRTVYRDDGSGIFEMDGDTLVTTVATLALSAGVQTVV